jgi:uncharacterized protein
MEVALFLLIGVVAGISGGFFGIGGGIIIVPALIYLMGYTQKMAQGTSLVALLAPVGLLGLINYYKAGNANIVGGAWMAAGFFFGAFFGSKIALGLDEVLLRRIFAAFLVIVAVQLVLRK